MKGVALKWALAVIVFLLMFGLFALLFGVFGSVGLKLADFAESSLKAAAERILNIFRSI